MLGENNDINIITARTRSPEKSIENYREEILVCLEELFSKVEDLPPKIKEGVEEKIKQIKKKAEGLDENKAEELQGQCHKIRERVKRLTDREDHYLRMLVMKFEHLFRGDNPTLPRDMIEGFQDVIRMTRGEEEYKRLERKCRELAAKKIASCTSDEEFFKIWVETYASNEIQILTETSIVSMIVSYFGDPEHRIDKMTDIINSRLPSIKFDDQDPWAFTKDNLWEILRELTKSTRANLKTYESQGKPRTKNTKMLDDFFIILDKHFGAEGE